MKIFNPHCIQLLEVLPYLNQFHIRLERTVLVFGVWTQWVDVQQLIYWQGQPC
jgi:hypothetical protein